MVDHMDAPTPTTLERIATHIADDGIALLPAAFLTDAVAAAREAGASEVVIDVFVDPTEPAVARERAFVKLTSRIIGHSIRQESVVATASSVTLAA